eukprot:3258226-Amphidinium_carterae.1
MHSACSSQARSDLVHQCFGGVAYTLYSDAKCWTECPHRGILNSALMSQESSKPKKLPFIKGC